MSSDVRQIVRLADCASFQEGYVNPSQTEPSFFGSDIKWLRANDLNNGFVFNTSRSLSQKGFESAGKSATLFEPGTLAISKSGTIGRIGILKDYMCGNRAVINIKVDSSCDTRFIFYTLLLKRQLIEMLAEGSVQKNLYISNLGNLKIELPIFAEQTAISEVLCAFDDRITLLRETNSTLEAIAQALFKSWFVDFDPVRAKQEGREPEGMDADTAALFPDSFEESELGLVPKGWNHVPFTDTVYVIGGGTPKTSIPEYWNGDIPWFSVVDAPTITDVFVIDTQKHITEQGLNNSSTKMLMEGTTIISARGTIGRLALVGREMAMNQSCYGLRGKADDSYFTYFSTYRLVESLKQRSHGSVFDTITTETMKGVFVVYPDKAVVQALETLLLPIMNRMKNNLEQAQTLTTLRDTLLPRLISGQLRLPDAETLIEEATA
jgi:restriction endonuclease S subunit